MHALHQLALYMSLVCTIIHHVHAMEDTSSKVASSSVLSTRLQDLCLKKIISTLQEDSELSQTMLFELEQGPCKLWQDKIKHLLINENLIPFCTIFKEHLPHQIGYYNTPKACGLHRARSGGFVLGGEGFVVLALQEEIIGDTATLVPLLDLWIIDDLTNSAVKEKKPRTSCRLPNEESGRPVWYPAMKVHTSYHSNRFIINTPKFLLVFNISEDNELVHEATLEVTALPHGISLSPDGTRLAVTPPQWCSPALLLPLDKLCDNGKSICISLNNLKLANMSSEPAEFAQWSTCGAHLVGIKDDTVPATITLWDMQNDTPLESEIFDRPDQLNSSIFRLSSNKKTLLCLAPESTRQKNLSLYLIDIETKKLTECNTHYQEDSKNHLQFHSIQESLDNRYCVISSMGTYAGLCDIMTKELFPLYPPGPSPTQQGQFCIHAAHINKDNTHVLCFYPEEGVYIFSLQAPAMRLSLRMLFVLQKIMCSKTTPETKTLLVQELTALMEKKVQELTALIKEKSELAPLLETLTSYVQSLK